MENSKNDTASIEDVRKIKIHMNCKMYWNSFQWTLPLRFNSINKSFYFVFFIFDLLHDLLELRQVWLEKKSFAVHSAIALYNEPIMPSTCGTFKNISCYKSATSCQRSLFNDDKRLSSKIPFSLKHILSIPVLT